jgi:hypothetical protein
MCKLLKIILVPLRKPVMASSLIYLYLQLKAIHNKDDSVVKTFKVGQLAFFCVYQ